MQKPFIFAVALFAFAVFPVSAQSQYEVTTVAQGLNKPWTAVALSDGRWLITERPGFVVIVDGDDQSRFKVELPDLFAEGQGGLLDFAPLPDFSEKRQGLITYVSGSMDSNTLVVASVTVESTGALTNVKEVFRVSPSRDTPVHYGGRLGMLADGTWLVTSGDGFDYREQAQVVSSQLGKVLRFTVEGQPVDHSPWPEHPYIYSIGHRNPQGLVIDNVSNRVWLHEHGPAGGDEVNDIKAGKNYGWPVATHGKDYSGARISPFQSYSGMEDPLVHWTPSIAPSGMTLYRHELFAELSGKLIISTLKAKGLFVLNPDEPAPRAMPTFATVNQRIRDVTVAQDGAVMVLTDSQDAELLRIHKVP